MLTAPSGIEGLRDRNRVSTRKTLPDTFDVAQCRQSFEIPRQSSLARKELQHSLGAGANCAFPYGRLCSGTRIEEKPGALDAYERLLPLRSAAIAKRLSGKPKQ